MSDRNPSTKHLSDYLKIKVKLIKATRKQTKNRERISTEQAQWVIYS